MLTLGPPLDNPKICDQTSDQDLGLSDPNEGVKNVLMTHFSVVSIDQSISVLITYLMSLNSLTRAQELDPVLGAVMFLIRRPRELNKMLYMYQKRGAQP